jgi:nucleotide-binding universal stress UspA family protein
MKTILVPTDFSEHALQAAKAAVLLASPSKAKIVLQHNVYAETNWNELPSARKVDYPHILMKNNEAKRTLEKLVKSNIFKSANVSYSLTFGIAYEEILSKAKKIRADLIIMGSHGNENSDHYFIGSNTQKVLREAPIPVLLIKKDTSIRNWKNVAIAADFNLDMTRTFERVKNIVKEVKSTPHLLFVNRPADFLDTRSINSKMDNFIKKFPGLRFTKHIYNQVDVEDGILNFAEDNKMDWIILLTRERKSKPKYMIGNTETLAFHATVPVLSVNILPKPLK